MAVLFVCIIRGRTDGASLSQIASPIYHFQGLLPIGWLIYREELGAQSAFPTIDNINFLPLALVTRLLLEILFQHPKSLLSTAIGATTQQGSVSAKIFILFFITYNQPGTLHIFIG